MSKAGLRIFSENGDLILDSNDGVLSLRYSARVPLQGTFSTFPLPEIARNVDSILLVCRSITYRYSWESEDRTTEDFSGLGITTACTSSEGQILVAEPRGTLIAAQVEVYAA